MYISYHIHIQYHLNMIYKVPIGFYRYPPWLDSQYLWWLFSRPLNGGEGMVTIMTMNIRYAINYEVKNIVCRGNNILHNWQTIEWSIKMPCIFQTKQSCWVLFVCLLAWMFGWGFFPIFFLFSEEADVDNEISREIDVMLENIQNSL